MFISIVAKQAELIYSFRSQDDDWMGTRREASRIGQALLLNVLADFKGVFSS